MDKKTSAKDLWVRWAILIVGSLVVLAMAYGSGMRAQTGRIRAVDELRKVAERDLRMAQRESHLRLAAAQQLEARRQVSLGLLELDKRNFGTAQERLKTAVELLQTAQKAEATVPNLSEIGTRLSAVNLAATPDTGAQRTILLAIVEEMDKTLGDFAPGFLENAAKSDAAAPIKKPTMNDVPLPPAPGNDVTRTK